MHSTAHLGPVLRISFLKNMGYEHNDEYRNSFRLRQFFLYGFVWRYDVNFSFYVLEFNIWEVITSTTKSSCVISFEKCEVCSPFLKISGYISV